MTEITFDQLKEAASGGSVAIRSRLELKPAGGPEDKVFPPSYGGAKTEPHKYADETRQIGDKLVKTILLDSVASQANRAELALLDGWQAGELEFPVPYVDFTESEVSDIGKLTALEAPHRIFDAIFRDSLLEGTLFRLSEVGQEITNANPRDASALFRYCPTSLLFGAWDSTGPKGGRGSKFQRAYVSEIVGLDAEVGKKVRSRLDPLQIEKLSADDTIYKIDGTEVWSFNEKEGKDKGKGGKTDSSTKPSEINHGNIPPSIDPVAGGVTISTAVQTTVISLAAIRKLRFGDRDIARDNAAYTVIAALGLAAIAYQYDKDFDLRSRCLLVPTELPKLELLARDGSAPEEFSISPKGAREILKQASDEVNTAGFGWETSETKLELTPAPKLVELISRSRRMSQLEKPGEEEDE